MPPHPPGAQPEIDRLYQLPPADFVSERNALAKRVPSDAAAIKALQKPAVPAWAVNQLYWRDRETYQELLDRAADLRATHAAASRGERADLRGAGRAYNEAVDRAIARALGILGETSQPVTDTTRQAIATTIRSLPAAEPPGRLTKPLQPRGFDLLAAPAAGGRARVTNPGTSTRKVAPAPSRGKSPTLAARRALAAAEEATRTAEQQYRREEFEAARAAKAAEKASRRAEEAEAALQDAQAALERAQAARDAAAHAAAAALKAREGVQGRAAAAADRLAAARDRETAARELLHRAEH